MARPPRAGACLRTNQFDLTTEGIKPIADIFTPIFFVGVGAAVDGTRFMPWSAHLGLRNGILSSEVFSAILIMVMLTTFVAPPALKGIFRRMDRVPVPAVPPVRPGATSIGSAGLE